MVKIFVSLLVLLLLAPIAPLTAQCLTMSDGKRPSWIDNSRHRPQETENSVFMLIFVEGPTLGGARRQAEAELFAARSRASSEWGNLNNRNDGVPFQVDNPELLVRAQCLGEHFEFINGRYQLWQLVQIAKRPNRPLETIPRNQITRLEKHTLGLKPFVPGMAQIHKGSNIKGALFIISEAALIGGIVATEVFRADNESKINTTFNVAQRQSYIDNANNLQNARNILIAGAAAVYMWNVIDGFVAKSFGRGNFAQTPDSYLRIMPYVDSQLGAGGLTLTLNF
jgi:hypothetical protein